MTEELFQNLIRDYRNREPYQPFVLEFNDGRILEIDDGMAIGFNGDYGSFMTREYDHIEFSCNDIRDIRLLVPETHP